MTKRKRRKKIVRSEFQNVLNMLMAKTLIELFKATNPQTEKEIIIDIPYEEVESEATSNIYLSQIATDERRKKLRTF